MFVFSQAEGECCVPLFEFAAQSRDLALKLAIRRLHASGRGHERVESLCQRALCDAWRQNHWSVMRSRQHLPTCNAKRMPNGSNLESSVSKVTSRWTRTDGAPTPRVATRSQYAWPTAGAHLAPG